MGHHFYTIDKVEGDRAEREAKFKFEGPAAFWRSVTIVTLRRFQQFTTKERSKPWLSLSSV